VHDNEWHFFSSRGGQIYRAKAEAKEGEREREEGKKK